MKRQLSIFKAFANSEGGPKRLRSDSCEAESCFPGYRIIETTANGSCLFEAIAHQPVAGTYNVPAGSGAPWGGAPAKIEFVAFWP